jgi:glycosyltransferase involved in cell wall biosynthesis
MSDELVSIVIPTYNRADCVTRAVDSALRQTHGDVDVIVIDDGSKDATETLMRDTYAREPRVRYVRQENRGVSAARNHGIRLVRGAYAALLDSDDVWEPFKLELQLACLRAFPDTGMVWTDMMAVDTDGTLLHEHYLKTFYSAYNLFSRDDLFDISRPLAEVAPKLSSIVGDKRVYAGEIYAPMVIGNLVHTSTVLLRRDRLEQTGLFDETRRSGEDHQFHLHTCRAGRVAYADIDAIRYERGRSDALAHPNDALDRDRDRIRLPQEMIDAALADGHRWVAEAFLDRGEAREARSHLVSSLRHDPRQLRLLKIYASSWLPSGARERLVATYHRLRGRRARS